MVIKGLTTMSSKLQVKQPKTGGGETVSDLVKKWAIFVQNETKSPRLTTFGINLTYVGPKSDQI